MTKFLGNPIPQFMSSSGVPLSSGTLTAYEAGTTTLTSIYPSLADAAAGTNALPNPNTLNSYGSPQTGGSFVTPIVVLGNIKLVLKDSSGSTIYTVDNYNPDYTITDANGNELVKFSTADDAVNEITVANAATGNNPSISATGGDTNIGLDISSKGTGAMNFTAGSMNLKDDSSNEFLKLTSVANAVNEVTITNAATGDAPSLVASGNDSDIGIIITAKGAGAVALKGGSVTFKDSSDNEIIIVSSVANAVNEVTLSNAIASTGPSISSTGSDTDISLNISGKGTGAVRLGTSTSSGITLLGDQPLRDSSNLRILAFDKASTAVNYLSVSNSATTLPLIITCNGNDTNVALTLAPKGTGGVNIGATATSASVVRLYEQTTNGTNFVGLKAPTTVSADVTFTLPSADGTSGQALTTNGSGTMAWSTVGITSATQAQQEAASSTTVSVTPGNQQYHPSAAKAFGRISYSGGTPSVATAYNLTSVTDSGIGDVTCNWGITFSASTAQCPVATILSSLSYFANVTSVSTTTTRVECYSDSGASTDPIAMFVAVFGDL